MVEPLYRAYGTGDNLVVSVETEEEYLNRVKEEIYGSRKIIEDHLAKKVEFLCWPHGDNNEDGNGSRISYDHYRKGTGS